jgi:phosphoribosyl 1,2-cyclic phosphate phosphodiesterase
LLNLFIYPHWCFGIKKRAIDPMRITFLGTAASEGYPDAFCVCRNCEQARSLGGQSLRKRCSALIDNQLLIDLGPDLLAASMLHGVSLAGMRYCLQTHEHEDHLDPSNLLHRSQYCGVYNTPHLDYYASRGAFEKIARHFAHQLPAAGLFAPEVGEKLNLTAHCIEPFQTVAVGPYQVTAVAASHAPDLTAMLFVIVREGRTLFYATDTGEIPESSWQALAEGGFRFNLVAMDHTFGLAARVSGHMNWEQFVEQIERMHRAELLAEDARILAHHLAHHSNPPHPQLSEFATGHGYAVAFDGMSIDV